MGSRLVSQTGNGLRDRRICSIGRIASFVCGREVMTSAHADKPYRHARACRGHPRLYGPLDWQVVDGRDEPGHDSKASSGDLPVVPSLLSFSTTPILASSSRMRSNSAKFLSLRTFNLRSISLFNSLIPILRSISCISMGEINEGPYLLQGSRYLTPSG